MLKFSGRSASKIISKMIVMVIHLTHRSRKCVNVMFYSFRSCYFRVDKGLHFGSNICHSARY